MISVMEFSLLVIHPPLSQTGLIFSFITNRSPEDFMSSSYAEHGF